MSLWVDKHRPIRLKDIEIHAGITVTLANLAKSEEIPHLLVYGPPGAGKKTRVMALLREIYGPGAERIKIEHRSFKTTTKTIDITTLGSNYHIECNPSDVGNQDRFVIQEVIKEIASHSSLQSGSASARSFKIVILTEVDRLTKQAQAGLRRTMEKYSSQCRLILLCNSPSKIIEPVRSRCLGVRVPAPTHEEIADVLIRTAKKEHCQCELDLAMKISLHSDRNLRRALLMLEATRMQLGNSPSQVLTKDLSVQLPDWELFIIKLAREILQEQTPSRLLQAREMLYSLLTNCIPADLILRTLVRELMKSMDDSMKHEVLHWVAYYEHRVSQGSKEIFHLEAFVAKFMALYKKFLVEMFA